MVGPGAYTEYNKDNRTVYNIITSAKSTFKRKIELKKYFREEYDLMLMVQQQQLYELQCEAELLKGKMTPESS